jgi:RNase P subunit RPR2
MAFMDFLTKMTCSTCKTELVRVPQTLFPIAQTKPDTSIVCVDCGALGRYEEVVKGAGMIRILTKDQCADLIAKLGVSPYRP